LGAKGSIGKTVLRRFIFPRFDLPRFLRWVLVIIIYLITFTALDQLTHTLQLFSGVVAWYPSDGLSLAFLLTFGTGFTPVFILASLISSFIVFRLSAPVGPLLVWAVILSAVYGIDAWLLRHRAHIDPQLKNLHDTLWLILSSAIVSTLLAVIAVSAFVKYGIVPSSQYFNAFVQWWIGEMVGVLVFTPFLLVHAMPWLKRFIDGGWANSKKQNIFLRPSLLTLGQVISIPVILYLVFGIPALRGFQPLYLIAGPLIWIALENGFSRVSLAIVAMNIGTILAIWLYKFDTSRLGELQFLMFGIYASTLLTGAIVTKQKRTEEELRQRDVRNRALIENAPDAITLLGADGLLKYLSPSTRRILGYAPEEKVGSNPAEFTHPDDLPTLLKLLDDLSQKPGKVITTQYRIRHNDGSWRWLESTITNLLVEPSVQAIVFNFRDITERKQTEETLQKSEKRFRALVEHSLEEISLVDPDGTLTYESPTSRRPLGYPPNSFVGHNLFDLFHPDERAAAARLLKQTVKHPGSVKEALFRLRHQDGSWRWMEGSLTNLLDEPAVQAVVINYRDVTERRQAEETLRVSEDRYRDLVDNSQDLICTHDLEGRILSVNPFSEQLLGYTSSAFLKMNIRDILAPEWQRLFDVYLHRLQKRGVAEGIMVVQTIHGEKRIWEYKNTLRTEGVATPVVRGMARDVTERNLAEKALRDSEYIFRSFLEQSEDAIMLTNDQGVLVQWSKGAEKLTGFSREESLGQPIWDIQFRSAPDEFKSTENYERIKAALQTALLTGKGSLLSKLIEAEIQRPDGTRLTTQTMAFPVHTDKGFLLGSILRDITERKQAEEEIKISNDELAMLFELSHSLAEADNLEDILDLVNRHAVESIHTTFARIALLEDETYIMRAAYPIRVLDHDLRIGERNPVTSLPYTQRVLEQKEPMILRATDQGIGNEEKKALLLDFAQSLCLIPLRISDSSSMSENLLGLLMLGEARNEGREPFTLKKIRLAQSIGDSAAIAIRRMLLREQTERRLQQIIALSEIDRAILSSSDMDVSLEVLLLQAIEQLKVDAADVWLFNPTSQALEFVSGRGFRTPAFENVLPLHLGEGNAGRAALERRTIHVPNLTAHNDHQRLTKALAEEPFISYYAVPLIVKEQVKGVLELFHRTELEPNEEWLKFLHALANQAAIAIDNSSLFNDLQYSNAELIQAYDATIQGWSKALDLRDKETEGHTQRVTELTMKLGRQFGLPDKELVHVRRGALLHDIGKMGVPDGILLKPGPLTDEEWILMRKHTTFAYEMLSPIHYLRPALDIPYCHHEKWDGTGYPRGLSGDQIPFAARIFAVVDVWDALTSDRPYRAAWPEEKVLDHIRSLAGTHFDPQIVKISLESGLLKGQKRP
jgi:PAS domain S-box-containing protein/putative nucleotidyltransferase with HDIG domain